MSWAAEAGRTRQKRGAWTKKKIRRQRRQTEQARQGERPESPRRERVVRLPHEM